MTSALDKARVFGVLVRKRREELGLTLEQLAERSDLTLAYVGTIENGKRSASLSNIMALARALEVPLAELLPQLAYPALDWSQPDGPPRNGRPPTPAAPAFGAPAQFEIPFTSLDRTQEIAPWWPRRAAG